MNLKRAREVGAEMEKNLGGEYREALKIFGAYLSFLSAATRGVDFGPPNFMDEAIAAELHEACPEMDVPAPFRGPLFADVPSNRKRRSER